MVTPLEIPLDHNFPEPILKCLHDHMSDIWLRPIRDIHAGLPELGDREMIIALHQLGYEMFITNNYRMLRNPLELAAILRTGMNVFAVAGVGDDPLRATGAVLLDLLPAVRKAAAGGKGIFWFRPRAPEPQDAWDLFNRAASGVNRSPSDLYDEVKVSDEELAAIVLS